MNRKGFLSGFLKIVGAAIIVPSLPIPKSKPILIEDEPKAMFKGGVIHKGIFVKPVKMRRSFKFRDIIPKYHHESDSFKYGNFNSKE